MKTKFIITFVILTVLLSTAAANFAAGNTKLSLETVQTGDDKFDKIFREGRDLIDKEDWKQAAAKFSEIVCDCPEKKGVDAAFYWLAFTYKKQKMYAEMTEALNRLQKNFPNSSWADDARVMRLQEPVNIFIAANPSNNVFTATGVQTFVAAIADSQSNKPLEREEEIKLAAFQSLYASDPKRAVEILGDVLSPDSKTGENLQIQMLRLVRSAINNRFSLSYRYDNSVPASTVVSGNTVTATTNSSQTSAEKRAALASRLREVLMRSYKTAARVEVKSEILYFFGGTEESANFLASIYGTENDKQIKRTIIRALSGGGFSPVYLATNRDAVRKANFDKLLEIYKNERDTDLRTTILSSLQSFRGWSQNETLFQTLLQTYEAETDEKIKSSLITLFGQMKSAQTIAKLLDIAKNDKSDKLRMTAIRSLQGINTPEVIKFLEDLIK